MYAYTEKALKSIFENLSSECVSGGRNSSLNKNAMEAYQFVTGGYVDREHVSRKLSEIA